jgi:uncharacterized protein YcnI
MTLPCSGRAQRPRRTRRALGVAATVTAFVVATALPAFAHVTVSSPDASPGGFGKLVFLVPNELPKALTTKVEVNLPTATPFASVSAKPVDGWTVSTTERKLAKPVKDDDGFNITKAVGTVTWTAQPGKGLAPGQFEEFELSVGPFPEKAGELSLPATQTYSDGTVVKWDEPTPAGGKEPEHPAPRLDVAKAQGTSTATATTPTRTSGSHAGSTDGVARWLGAGGLLVGLVALALALGSARRRRDAPSAPAPAQPRESTTESLRS